jgi:hypothetical protein
MLGFVESYFRDSEDQDRQLSLWNDSARRLISLLGLIGEDCWSIGGEGDDNSCDRNWMPVCSKKTTPGM